jgi:hypothetical protein
MTTLRHPLLDAFLMAHMTVEGERKFQPSFENDGRDLEETKPRSVVANISSPPGFSSFSSHAIKRLEERIRSL